jgi:glycosyltransferase involved in cell wall biosynthesis
VALVAPYPTPSGKASGGVRAVVQNLVRGLQTYDDLQIHVIHCHADIQESVMVEDNNIQIHYIATLKRRLIPNMLTSIVRVERSLHQVQPDVVNTHAAHYTVAALRAGYPTVFTIHGVMDREAQVYTSTWFDRCRFLFERWWDRYSVRHVQDIVAISPYVLEEYRGRSGARFHRIDNPLASQFFTIPNLEEEGQVLYVGSIDERKNVLDLLRALTIVREQIPDVRLCMAGRTTSQLYYRSVREFVGTQSLERNIAFLGLQDREHLLQEYARCCIVVLSSRQETTPMAVIEAMAAGKPVVATRVGGVSDLVEDGGSGFTVELGDVEGFARHMVELLSNQVLRRRMGQRARQLAGRFHVEIIAAQYRQLYYQVAGRTVP